VASFGLAVNRRYRQGDQQKEEVCFIDIVTFGRQAEYAVLRALKDGDLSEDEAIKRLERSPLWVWTAMDPKSKLLVVVDVGTRTLAMAQRVVHQVTRVLAPGCVPLFLTDGLKDYGTALLTHFGHWIQPERRQAKGPTPKAWWMPLPELLYAQVVKAYRRQRIVGVKHRVVFGSRLAIEQILARCGWSINTAFVERLNLDIRQCVAVVGRRVNTLCQGETGLQDRLVLFQVYHNFGWNRRSWRPCHPATAGRVWGDIPTNWLRPCWSLLMPGWSSS
jgi:hypothetical protein